MVSGASDTSGGLSINLSRFSEMAQILIGYGKWEAVNIINSFLNHLCIMAGSAVVLNEPTAVREHCFHEGVV